MDAMLHDFAGMNFNFYDGMDNVEEFLNNIAKEL